VEELHREEERAVVAATELVHDDDVRVVDAGRGAGLALEAGLDERDRRRRRAAGP
jgi:hypothetical protein